eukprot:jgi/Tetstr1/462577/TSEL_007563.t1
MLNMTAEEVSIVGVTNGSVVIESVVSNPPNSPLDDDDTANSIRAALAAGLDDAPTFNARLASFGFPAEVVLEEVPQEPFVEADGVAVPVPSPPPPWDSDEYWHDLHDQIKDKPWVIGVIVAILVVILLLVVLVSCLIARWMKKRASRPKPIASGSLQVGKTPQSHPASVAVHVSPAGLNYSRGFDDSCPIPRPPPPSTGFPPWTSINTPGWASPGGPISPGMLHFGASPNNKPSASAIRLHMSPPKPRGSPGMDRFDHVVLSPSLTDDQVEGLRSALRHDVALVCYDYRTFSLPEFVDIVEGYSLALPFLAQPAGLEMLAFWQQLCGFVRDGGRISLLGANLTKKPERGVALLRRLQDETKLLHVTSDDMARGFPLQMLSEDGRSFEETGVAALDDYFYLDRFHEHFHGFK